MPGGLFPRIKTWIFGEDLDAQDLDNEFDNIIQNLNPEGISGYEASVGQMQIQEDPGSLGSENLGVSIADDEAQLRFVIARLLGTTYWYEAPPTNLTILSNLLANGSVPPNRVASGRVDGFQQPMFLQAAGSAAKLSLLATATNFVYYVAGTLYTLTSDILSSILTLAPSSGNTAVTEFQISANLSAFTMTLLSNALLPLVKVGQVVTGTGIPGGTTVSAIDGNIITTSASMTTGSSITVTFGYAVTLTDTEIPMINAGSAILAKVGSFATFQIGSEYFTAYVRSSTQLSYCTRGIYFGSSDNNFPAAAQSAGATLTLMETVWVFVTSTQTLAYVYNPPSYSFLQPSSPNTGDYWFNFTDGNWYVYTGSWVMANATLLGVGVLNSSDCVATRSADPYANYQNLNNIGLENPDTATIQSTKVAAQISVYGNVFKSGLFSRFKWPSSVLDTGTIQDSTNYFVYVTSQGDVKLSATMPIDRNGDLFGWYHPAHPWRCVGAFTTDASGNFQVPSSYGKNDVLPQPVLNINSGPQASFSITSATPVAVPGVLVNIATKGRPVLVLLQPDGSTNGSFFRGENSELNLYIFRDGVQLAIQTFLPNTGAGTSVYIPATMAFLDTPGPGTHTYQLYVSSPSSGLTFVVGVAIAAWEL